jgi:hypothetical protein
MFGLREAHELLLLHELRLSVTLLDPVVSMG